MSNNKDKQRYDGKPQKDDNPRRGNSKDFGKGKDNRDRSMSGKPKDRWQDASWYAADSEAVKNMASLPFLEVVGDSIASKDAVPGIVTLEHVHTVGNSAVDKRQPGYDANYLTRAGQAYYQYLVQGFTGGVDFEAPDLMMTAIAGASLAAAFAEGVRVYGFMRYYLQFNSYYAKQIVEALGFNFEDLQANMANFRTEFNIRARQFNDIVAVPKELFLAQRWLYIASNTFADTDSPSYSTLYAYVTRGYMKYDATTMKTGTCLKWRATTLDAMTTIDYFALLDDLMRALDDSDVRSIFGAVRRVYDDSAFIKVSDMPEEYVVPIVRNDVVGAAVHNAIWTSASYMANAPKASFTMPEASGTDVIVFQDETGNILTYPCIDQGDVENLLPVGNDTDILLDMYDHLVSPENILDITANMQVHIQPKADPVTGGVVMSPAYIGCRTEMLGAVKIYSTAYDTDAYPGVITKIFNSVTWSGQFLDLAYLSHLDSHPLIAIVSGSTINAYVGEIDKYTKVGVGVLAQLHARTFYQLLAMPRNSKSVTK